MTTVGWTPPPYPHDRLKPLKATASAMDGGIVDLSIGTPTDPPPPGVLAALADADHGGVLRGYPPSIGTAALRTAIAGWTGRTFGVDIDPSAIVACIGTKEVVASLPRYLALGDPSRDTVLYPAISYPTYEMGALLGGLRPVPVPTDAVGRLDLSAVAEEDAERALLLWVNSPGNPAGGLDDLPAAAAWGAAHGVTVASDECYAPFTWDGPPATVLGHGTGPGGLGGVIAVHSLSKRSNLAGLRVGWMAGDPELIAYLAEVRKHAGMMVPGPAQAAGIAALGDEEHVAAQRERYASRLEVMAGIVGSVTGTVPGLPGGGFYLWVPAPGGDGWAWTEELAVRGGLLGSPGELYGEAGAGYVRLAMVAPLDRLELAGARLGAP